MFDPMTHVAVGEQVEEMVGGNRKRTKIGQLSTRERHVVGHEFLRIGGKGVVDPDMELHALLLVAVVPHLGRSHPR